MKMHTVLLFSVSVILSACGGGGSTAVSVSTFNVKQAFENFIKTSDTKNVSFSGTSSGLKLTGTGRATLGGLVPSTFQGVNALLKTSVNTGTLTDGKVNIPLSTTSLTYWDSGYNFLGRSGSDFGVVTKFVPLPTAAKINDTGSFYTITNYPSSAKSYIKDTTTVSFSLAADSEISAIVTLIKETRDTSGKSVSTEIEMYRVTTSGVLTIISETGFQSTPPVGMTITYQ